MDLDERPALHQKGWKIQPIGKALVLLIMLAGLLGLFGNGWLSKQWLLQGRTQIKFERFYRRNSDMKLEVAAAGVAGRSAISFPLGYIKNFEVVKIVPEPERSFVRDGQLWYVFEAEQNLQADFYLRASKAGSIAGSVFVNEENIPIHHFIYP